MCPPHAQKREWLLLSFSFLLFAFLNFYASRHTEYVYEPLFDKQQRIKIAGRYGRALALTGKAMSQCCQRDITGAYKHHKAKSHGVARNGDAPYGQADRVLTIQ